LPLSSFTCVAHLSLPLLHIFRKHIHTHTHTDTHSLSHAQTYTHSLTHTHTHTHIHTHAYSHSFHLQSCCQSSFFSFKVKEKKESETQESHRKKCKDMFASFQKRKDMLLFLNQKISYFSKVKVQQMIKIRFINSIIF